MNLGNCRDIRLRWVRGNDVLLRLSLYEPELDGEGHPRKGADGTPVWQPWDITACDSWAARIVSRYGRPTDVAAAPAADERNVLVMDIPGTLGVGTYSIEVTARRGGRMVRSFESPVFGVVERNCEASVTFDVIDGSRSTDTDMRMRLVASALARGQNAYELWRQVPGNEDKTLTEYLDSFWHPVAATPERDGLMTADDKRRLDGMEDGAQRNVQPDWWQNDAAGDGYVRNRTHWEEEQRTVWYDGEPVAEGAFGSQPRVLAYRAPLAAAIPDGTAVRLTLTVSYYGNVSSVVCEGTVSGGRVSATVQEGNFSGVMLRNQLGGRYPGDTLQYNLTIAGAFRGSLRLRVESAGALVHQIAEKYIPEGIVRQESMERAIADAAPPIVTEEEIDLICQ